MKFATFDELIDNVETVLEGMVEYYGITRHAELIITGFSSRRSGPEAYVIETSNSQPRGTDAAAAERAKAEGYLPDAYELQRLPDMVFGPVPTAEVLVAADFEGFTVDDDPAFVIAGMSKMIEMQRHSIFDDGICWVGGYAQITTINSAGIHQRIMHRWPEDLVGKPMKPAPINWSAWHARSSNVIQLSAKCAPAFPYPSRDTNLADHRRA